MNSPFRTRVLRTASAKENYNLLDEKWIPVLYRDGQPIRRTLLSNSSFTPTRVGKTNRKNRCDRYTSTTKMWRKCRRGDGSCSHHASFSSKCRIPVRISPTPPP